MINPKFFVLFLILFSRFVIGREKPGEQSEVAQLIQQTLEQERWQREMMEQRYKQYMDDDEEVHAQPLYVVWEGKKQPLISFSRHSYHTSVGWVHAAACRQSSTSSGVDMAQ